MSARRGLVGLVAAYAVSLTGTRVSAIALPWFVLVTTGSAAQTGLVVFAEMMPYVVVKALAGPAIDQRGPRRVSVVSDLVSTMLVAAVPVAHLLGALPFELLLILVAATGAARGPGDAAKTSLVPDVALSAAVPLERVTGLVQTVERLASTVGPAAAGVLVAAVDPASALFVDAASFAIAAACIAATAPAHAGANGDTESYAHRLRAGATFLRGDGLLWSIAAMVSMANLLDTALLGVLLPVWARDSGAGPAAIGAVTAATFVTAIAGSTAATAFGHRLPRRTTYFTAFIIDGAPRFAVLALDVPLWTVLAVWALCGLAGGLVNPIVGAVVLERIPPPLVGRTTALVGALAWLGIPFGGVVGGGLVALAGLNPALLVAGAAYLLTTTLPGLHPAWHDMDATRRSGPGPVAAARDVSASRARPGRQAADSVIGDRATIPAP